MSKCSYESVIFVFYEPIHSSKWTYKNKFPKGWTWTGVGSTSNKYYPQEEQFDGPKESRTSMKKLLDDYFKKLKKNGIIVRYKIRYSYKP